MFDFSLIYMPMLLALLRFGYGRGVVSKPWLFALPLLAAYAALSDITTALLFTAYFACLVVPPTHALFSAGHGNKPSREDHPMWQWMRSATGIFTTCILAPIGLSMGKHKDHSIYWYVYGVVYGAVRSSITLPVIGLLWYYLDSATAAYGLLVGATVGILYYVTGRICAVFRLFFPNHMSVGAFIGYAEILTGLSAGLYYMYLKYPTEIEALLT